MLPGAHPGLLPADPPLDLTGQEARRLAELELSDPAYRAAEPSLIQRAIDWIVDQLSDLVDDAANAAPGGWLGILGLVALVTIAVLFIRWRLGPVRGTAGVTFAVDPTVSAAEYRAQAHAHAAAGAWEAAMRARMSALVRGAQERGLVDALPGWTADEIARALGEQLPAASDALDGAARTFDEVAYGGRHASEAAYRRVAEADERVSSLQLTADR